MPNNGNVTVIQYSNTCIIPNANGKPCGYRFDNLPLALPIIGERPEERAVKVIKKMGEHIALLHPSTFGAIRSEANEIYAPFRIASQFRMEDPNAVHHIKILRTQIVIAAGKPFVPDEHIKERIAGLPELTPESVFVLMATLRDLLCEIAPPSSPEVSKMIV